MLDNLDQVLSQLVVNIRQEHTPRRPNAILKHPERKTTGNLKYNALNVIKKEDGYHIYIDEDVVRLKNGVPYVVYTNEKWISPKWKGAKNPNENWFDNVALLLAQELAQIYKGVLQETKGIE